MKVSNKMLTILAMALVFCIMLWPYRGILVPESRAIRALDTAGYTDIEITDHAWFNVSWRVCGDDDVARFTASAVNPAGPEPIIMTLCISFSMHLN